MGRPLEVSRRDGITTVWWRAHPGTVLSGVVIAAVATLMAAGFAKHGNELDGKDLMLLVFVMLVSALGWYATLSAALNRVTLTMTSTELRVTQAPLPSWPIEVAVREITRFEARPAPRSMTFRVVALSAEGPSTVAQNLSEDRANELARVLNDQLS